MPKLKHPTVGTVVTVEGDLADRYRAAGWAEESATQDKATSEKPKQGRRSNNK